MVLLYGKCDENARMAAREYARKFPDRPHPTEGTFRHIVKSLKDTGCFQKPRKNRMRPQRTDDNVVSILARVAVEPTISIRRIEAETNISRPTIQRILKDAHLHAFKCFLTQELKANDFERRLHYIDTMSNLLDTDPNVLQRILWSDESKFYNNGVVNKHNCHYWSVQNPHWIHEIANERTYNLLKLSFLFFAYDIDFCLSDFVSGLFSVNVWCGIIGRHLIGPYFYKENLDGKKYLKFLRYVLPGLLENVPLNVRRNMIFQQDGAPAHNARIVVRHLDRTFPGRHLSTKGPLLWPPRSPDLTPPDFFLWGFLKEHVYGERINSVEEMQQKIEHACRLITPETLEKVTSQAVLHRMEACLEAAGQQFEQFL